MGGIQQHQGVSGLGRAERLAPFLDAQSLHVDGGPWTAADGASATVVADRRLQDIVEYRAAIAGWFAAVRRGGHLIITVPHALSGTGLLDLPVPGHPEQRRLYSPASLLDEVEQALSPGTYRVRLLFVDDAGAGDIVLVLEKRPEPPAPSGDAPVGNGARPDYAFEPARTRIEVATTRPRRRMLILKLDHLGDFILGLPAIERARALFADAHLTLAVGSWNLELAESLGLADEVRAFDAFPRNSAHEVPDVPGKRALFEIAFPGDYDVAIDLRTDGDTRTLLERVRAPVKAAIGTSAQFPFLNIALPIDPGRVEREDAREWRYNHQRFYSQATLARREYRLCSPGDAVERDTALVYGPYDRLRPGHYIFDPFLEIADGEGGLIMIDVALGTHRATHQIVTAGDAARLTFDVVEPETMFEFRIWAVEEALAPPFSFFGGRLVRAGAPGTLHQSDYQILLIELAALRLDRLGLLGEVAVA